MRANIGYYSMIAATLVGPRGRVVAFEPSRRVREQLLRSSSLNGFEQLTVRSEAVGAVAGEVGFKEPAGDNHGLGRVVEGVGAGDSVVRCVRLDDEPLAKSVALIKVDVEGGESAVFDGARRLLESPDAPSLLFEWFRLERDRRLLDELGYRIFVPGLSARRFCLRTLQQAPRAAYRSWEPPNFFAVKSRRGFEFCARHLAPNALR